MELLIRDVEQVESAGDMVDTVQAGQRLGQRLPKGMLWES